MSAPRITITIDRIVTDRPGLDRGDLAAALHRELQGLIAERGAGALGGSRSVESESGRAVNPDAAGVAGATIKAIAT